MVIQLMSGRAGILTQTVVLEFPIFSQVYELTYTPSPALPLQLIWSPFPLRALPFTLVSIPLHVAHLLGSAGS